MSNLTRLSYFLEWLSRFPDSVHLGKQILSQASELRFLPFFIDDPLNFFYARILVEGQAKALEGFVVNLMIDPEKQYFSIRFSNGNEYNITFDKLKSFEQLSSDELIESTRRKKSLAKSLTDRRPRCRDQLSAHYRLI